MRKHVKENKKEKATVSLRKILAISIILFMLTGMMGVMASTNQVKNVKIVLSSGYEMNVISSSTKVSDILKENNIVILDGETVIPGVDEELTDNKTITITKDEVQKKADITYLSENEILESYKSIVEKVITVEEEIPFETVTKDVSNGGDLQDRVVQAGQNGIKEVTYRIKYQNGNEIEKTKVSEVVTKEPVDKIVEVRTKVVSRASASRAVSGNVAEYQSYAYSKCKERGWSEHDFQCLVSLWNKESGWNPNACNRSTGAYGIPQNNNSSKYASWYRNSAYSQIDWGINYIAGRYGSPSGAWNASQRKGWY